MGGGHVSRPDFGMPQPDAAYPLTEFYLLAQQALAARGQVNASTLVEEYPNDFTGIIGLHTYSQSPHREYDITMTGNWVERGGFRFQDFVLTRRKEVNTDGNH